LATDASGYGLGAVLSQEINGEEHPIAYASRTLLEAECRYAVIEREALGIHWGVNHFDEYLDGPRHFTVYTDHKPLCALLTKAQTNKRLQNYSAKLSGYHFSILYRKGAHNSNADTLSRYPFIPTKTDLERIKSASSEPPDLDPPKEENVSTVNTTDPLPDQDTSTSTDEPTGLRKTIIHEPLFRAMTQYLESDSTVLDDKTFDIEVRSSSKHFLLGLHGELLRLNTRGRPTLCVPTSVRNLVLREAHDVDSAAHGGREKTLWRLAGDYWWPAMYKDVRSYLKNCTRCLEHKRAISIRQPLGERPQPQRVWERVHLDLWQPGGTSERGNVYVATFIDTVSKFIVAECIPDKTAETIVQVFTRRIACLYGVPDELYSDGAAEFRSKLMAEMTRAFGVVRKITTPYRPQANGQIERVFATLSPMLAAAVHKYPRRWDEFIPYVIFAYNTSYHRVIRDIPFYLFYGRDHYPEQFDLQRMLSPHLSIENAKRARFMQKARQLVLQKLRDAAALNKINYDKNARPAAFQVNDIVMLKSIRPAHIQAPKLFPLFVGPFRVISKKGEVLGVIPLGHPAASPRYIHSDRARLCEGDCTPNPSLAELLTPFDPSFIDQNLETDIPESSYE
jgi:transposase InsO family protein